MSRQARTTQPRTLIDYAGFGPPAIAWSRRPRSEESLRFGEQLVARAHARAVASLRTPVTPSGVSGGGATSDAPETLSETKRRQAEANVRPGKIRRPPPRSANSAMAASEDQRNSRPTAGRQVGRA